MAPEWADRFQDFFQYVHLLYRSKGPQWMGGGIDYTREEYRDVVRRVISRIHPGSMRMIVKEEVRETPSSKTFRLVRKDGILPPFRPGQYVNVFLEVDGVRTSRPYSISSPPGGDTLDITVRDKPDGFVAPYLLGRVEAGHELTTTGPLGTFYHEPLIHGTDLVFLAGGSGITPFMSMIRNNRQSGTPLRIHLLYGSRVPDDVIFNDELQELAAGSGWFQLTLVISEPPEGYRGRAGFIDEETIREAVGSVQGKTFYMCGPGPMYGFCRDELSRLGVPKHKVRRELYGPPDDVTRQAGWPPDLKADTIFRVEVEDRGGLAVRAGEPLMNALERSGILLPAECRSGECSACRTRLLSGRVFMPEQAGVRESDRNLGYIHPCVSYPLENLCIRLPSYLVK
jgi:ferredoxin-NADP reductase